MPRILLLLACFPLLSLAGEQVYRDTPYFYDEFDPQRVPWVAGEEKNIEEVFKNYRYYAIVYSQGGSRLSVTEYIQGKAKGVIDYQRDVNGRLLPQGQDATGGAGPDV
ncbi:MAG: hypothetical protein OEU91_01700 [Gammaproteobacteria bacterium]|nr:hypothetical protein [Gammaproteobacteria bacterium]